MTDDLTTAKPAHVTEAIREHAERMASIERLLARFDYASQRERVVTGIGLALYALADTERPSSGYNDPSGLEILEALGLLDDIRASTDDNEWRLIRAARERGATWDRIAEVLGYETVLVVKARYSQLSPETCDALDQRLAEQPAPGPRP
jgi:hypothetical protein